MALTFYYGSGSPFAWKVWLTLEHKQIPYEFRLLSFDRGDLKKRFKDNDIDDILFVITYSGLTPEWPA